MPDRNIHNVRERWRNLRQTTGFRNTMLFLVFVCVSTLFWFILALNDSAQDNFNVGLKIVNLPDSVTFISEVPEKIHVSVSDKGTHLWRNGYLKHPTVNIDFKEYSSDGILKYSYNDLIASLKDAFGSSAQITGVSLDSLQLYYTTNPGKIVPIVIDCQVYPASGSTLDGSITATPGSVSVYGSKEVLDTINYVFTDFLRLRDLNETTEVDVKIRKIPGSTTIPSEVTLTIPIQTLVKKEAMITVDAINVPEGEQMLLFPSKVPVEYYVAMTRLNDDEDRNIHLTADYDDINLSGDGKLPVIVGTYPDRLKNLKVKKDSVEFVLVH